jgi:hypothetical protein
MYSEVFERDICPRIKDPKNLQRTTGAVPIRDGVCSIWWVSTHYRLRAIYDDEKPDVVRDYNLGMRKFFEEGKRCGPVNYVDVYNMTADLAINHHEEALRMTYDQVHWGIEVNLQKAQVILNALLSAD